MVLLLAFLGVFRALCLEQRGRPKVALLGSTKSLTCRVVNRARCSAVAWSPSGSFRVRKSLKIVSLFLPLTSTRAPCSCADNSGYLRTTPKPTRGAQITRVICAGTIRTLDVSRLGAQKTCADLRQFSFAMLLSVVATVRRAAFRLLPGLTFTRSPVP